MLTASTLRETLWASDATAELLEELQFSLGEGARRVERSGFGQATGMVVAQLGVGAADAFARLRAHAFAERRPTAALQ